MNNMPEKLRERSRPAAAAPMAARAVGLCEGCPVAKFCVIKAVAPCETSGQQEAHIESSGGEYSGANLDKPVRLSYRDDLMSSKPVVMAELQKRKETISQIQPSAPVQPQAVSQRPPSRPASAKVPPRKVPAAPTARSKTPVSPKNGERTSDVVADILVSLFGVGSLATAQAKKSV